MNRFRFAKQFFFKRILKNRFKKKFQKQNLKKKALLKNILKRSNWQIPFLRNFWKKHVYYFLGFWVSFLKRLLLFEPFSFFFVRGERNVKKIFCFENFQKTFFLRTLFLEKYFIFKTITFFFEKYFILKQEPFLLKKNYLKKKKEVEIDLFKKKKTFS